MELFYFFLSLIISLGTIVVLRYADRNNRSFEKVHKLSKKVQDEIARIAGDNLEQLKNFDATIDASIKKGEGLMHYLNDAVKSGETKRGGQAADAGMMQKIAQLEKAVDENRQLLADGGNPAGISKNIKSLIKESVKEIKSIRSEIKKMQSEMDGEKKSVASMIEAHTKEVSARLVNYKKELETFTEEQWKNFTKQGGALQTDLKRLDEKMEYLRGDHLEQFQSNLTDIEDTQKKKILEMKEGLAKLQVEVQKDIEKKINDYSAYFSRLETRVDEYTKKLEKELAKEVELRLLDINKAAGDKIGEIDLHTDQVKTDARSALLKVVREYEEKIASLAAQFKTMEETTGTKITEYEAFLRESSVNIENIRNDIFSKIDEKQKALDIHLNNAAELGMKLELKVFDGIKGQLKKFKEAVDSALGLLDKQIKEKSADNDQKLNGYEKEISERGKAIEQTLADLSGKIERTALSTDEFISKTGSDLETLDNEVELLKREVDTEIRELRSGSDFRISEVSNDIAAKVDAIKKHFAEEKDKTFAEISKLLDEVTVNADGKTEELNGLFTEKFREIEHRLENIHTDMVARAGELEASVVKDAESIRNGFVSKQNELEEKIQLEIEKMREYLEERNSVLYHDVSLFENKLTGYLAEFDNRITDNDGDLKKVEKEYFERGAQYLSACESSIAQFEKELAHSNEAVAQLKNTIAADVQNIADSGRETIRATFENGKMGLIAAYQELEAESVKKINEYKEQMARLRHNLKLIEDKFDTQLEEKLLSMDKKFDGKMDMYNEKYRMQIADMSSRTDGVESEYQRKISELEDAFDRKNQSLFTENRAQLDLLMNNYTRLHEQMSALEQEITTGVDEKIASGQSLLSEQYQQLETDTVRRINEYKEELLAVRQSMDSLNERYEVKFRESGSLLDDRLKEKYLEVNERYADHLGELKEKFASLENDCKASLDSTVKSSNDRLNGFVQKFENLSSQIDNLKNKIDGEIAHKIDTGLLSLSSALEDKIAHAGTLYAENEAGFIEKIEEYKKEFYKIQQNMKQMDDKFTARFLEHSSVLDKRIAQIETEVKNFEKHTKLFDKTYNLKDRLSADIQELNGRIDAVKSHKADMDELEKKLIRIGTTVQDTDTRYGNILANVKKVETIEKTIGELRSYVDDAETRMEKINEARIAMSSIENELAAIDSRHRAVEKLMANLEAKEHAVQGTAENITRLDISAKEIDGKISLMARKLDEVTFKEETYEKSLKNFEKDAHLILQSQDRVMSVVEKFNQMDSLIEDLEVRTEAINKHREWLVKAQTQMENLNQMSDKKIKVLETLMDRETQKEDAPAKGEDSVRESVLKLKKQGWSIDDIAKTLNLSIGEVEFILDLEMDAKNR